MKYRSIDNLPKGVKDNLPHHAQEIYLSTFNNAFKDHKDENDVESISHKIAWSAVKQTYEKTGNRWHRK